jgi:hypothetical protein
LLLVHTQEIRGSHDTAAFTPTPFTSSKGWVPHSSRILA